MKKLFKPLITGILLVGLLQNPVVAQTNTNDMDNSAGSDRRDNSGMWGLLGLLGLVGFIRMNKNDKTSTYSTANHPQNR